MNTRTPTKDGHILPDTTDEHGVQFYTDDRTWHPHDAPDFQFTPLEPRLYYSAETGWVPLNA